VSTRAPACPRCGCPSEAWQPVAATADDAAEGGAEAGHGSLPHRSTPHVATTPPLAYAAPAVIAAAPAPNPRVVRHASSNCVAMFVLFLLYVLAVPLRLTGTLPTFADALLGLFLIPAGIYCLFYLPLRWSVIRTLPVDRRIPGAIGGIGLIVLLFIAVVYVVSNVKP
jgi:hypothetical protein